MSDHRLQALFPLYLMVDEIKDILYFLSFGSALSNLKQKSFVN